MTTSTHLTAEWRVTSEGGDWYPSPLVGRDYDDEANADSVLAAVHRDIDLLVATHEGKVECRVRRLVTTLEYFCQATLTDSGTVYRCAAEEDHAGMHTSLYGQWNWPEMHAVNEPEDVT